MAVKEKHTEESITTILRSHYNQGYTYRLNNIFIYGNDWESDFFCVDDEGYASEFEIKISRADFKGDFKKYKHLLFRKMNKRGLLMPNKFYYVVPDGMVSPDDIPRYAGLIYVVGSHLKVVRRAPYLHKEKRDYRRIIAPKVYERYAIQRRQLAVVRYENMELKKMIRDFAKFLPKEKRDVIRQNFYLQEVVVPKTS